MTFDELSFVASDTSGDFPKVMPWAPKRSGDYKKDCETGRAAFRELSEYIAETDNPTLLGRVLEAQVRGGVWDATEIGFAQAMSEALMAASRE